MSVDATGGRAAGEPAPNPLVTVVIPAYDAEAFILDAIRSVEAQHYAPLEILVVDDGSRDRTVELVRRHAPDARIVQQPNAGVSAARNAGIRHARGELICFLDADDGWLPGKLDAQVAHLRQFPQVGAVYHRWHVWKEGEDRPEAGPPAASDRALEPGGSGWIYPLLLLDCIVHTSTVMVRKRIVDEVGLFETGLPTGEDYDYWLRVSRACEVHQLAGRYSYYREVPGSLTRALKAENNEYRVLQRALGRWGLASPDGTRASPQRVRARLSQLAFDFGYAHYHRGSAARARSAFAQAVRHDPLRWRAAAYYLAACIRQPRDRREPAVPAAPPG